MQPYRWLVRLITGLVIYSSGAPGVRALVASFGFDIDFVLRRIASGQRYDRIALLAIYTSEEAYKRVEKAYHALSYVCKSSQIDCVLEKISPGELFRSVYTTLQRVAAESDYLEVFLTGGPRMLVVALLLATLMLPEELLARTRLAVEGEGFECALLVDTLTFTKMLRLDERSRTILVLLSVLGKATLSELARTTKLPRSSVYRKLRDLVSEGLVEADEAASVYTSKSYVEVVCKS